MHYEVAEQESSTVLQQSTAYMTAYTRIAVVRQGRSLQAPYIKSMSN
jgi:hypothetical protein